MYGYSYKFMYCMDEQSTNHIFLNEKRKAWMLCKVIPTAQNACRPIPRSHQLCWGGREMGTAIWVSANILHVARYITLFVLVQIMRLFLI